MVVRITVRNGNVTPAALTASMFAGGQAVVRTVTACKPLVLVSATYVLPLMIL